MEGITAVEEDLKKTKELVKDTYKKIKAAKDQNDCQNLYKKLKELNEIICKIHNESYNLDKTYVWGEILTKVDEDTYGDLEQEKKDILLFGAQLLRGTVKSLNEYQNKIQ